VEEMSQSNDKSRTEFLKNWGDGLTRWSERWIPDALVIVFILTIIAFIFALIWGETDFKGATVAWGKGFWALLAFAMEMCLIMMTGYILACSPPVRWLLDRLSGWPSVNKPHQAIALMAVFSMVIAFLN
jgi:short-chain fatty acids transporter